MKALFSALLLFTFIFLVVDISNCQVASSVTSGKISLFTGDSIQDITGNDTTHYFSLHERVPSDAVISLSYLITGVDSTVSDTSAVVYPVASIDGTNFFVIATQDSISSARDSAKFEITNIRYPYYGIKIKKGDAGAGKYYGYGYLRQPTK